MKYNVSGLTRKSYEEFLNESLKDVILTIEGMEEMFLHVNVQKRYIVDAFNKKKFGRFIRVFDSRLFEKEFAKWREMMLKIEKDAKNKSN